MPASMATKLGIQFARFAQYTAASSNAGTHGLRSAFANASPGPTWAPGLSSSGTGVGGAKFQAGKGAHSSFQQSGKALANANASSASDSTSGMNDEDDDLPYHSPITGPRHRLSRLHQRQSSLVRAGVQARLVDQASPLHLIMPATSGARAVSTTKSIDSPSNLQQTPARETKEVDTISGRRQRSLSTSATQTQEVPVSSHAGTMSVSQSDGILVGRNDHRAKKASSELTGEAKTSFKKLLDSYLGRDVLAMRTSVEEYARQSKEGMSTPSFELAMRTLLRIDDRNVSDRILDLYHLMIESDCAPNTDVYGHVVRALCARDLLRQPKGDGETGSRRASKSDTDYHQALNFLDIVHAMSDGFSRTSVYDSILRSCTIRGDAETACLVVDRLSLNKKLTPSSHTFRLFLESFTRDTLVKPGESKEDFMARRQKACEHVLQEAEVFRQSSASSVNEEEAVKIFNVMISQSIQSGHADRAVEILGKMINGEALYEGGIAAPRPDPGTTRTLIRSLTAVQDLDSAVEWVQKIVEMNERCGPGEVPSMALPEAGTVWILLKKYLGLLHALVDKAKVSQDEIVISEHLKMVESANRLLSLSYRMPMASESANLEITDSTWRTVIDLNNRLINELITQGRLPEANTFMDFSLGHIEKHITQNEARLCWAIMSQNKDADAGRMPVEEEDSSIVGNLRSIIMTIERLILVDRRADAASCLTWVVALTPPINHGSTVTRYTLNGLMKLTPGILKLVVESDESYKFVGRPEEVNEHLMMALRYIVLSVGQLGHIPPQLNFMVSALYLEAKKLDMDGPAAILALESRERNVLLDSLLHADRGVAWMAAEAADVEATKTDGDGAQMLRMLLADLASLPESERELINLNKAISMLPLSMPREEAEHLLQAIRPGYALPAAQPAVAKHGEESSSTVAESSNLSSAPSATLSPSATSSVGEVLTPPTSEFAASFKNEMPPLQTVDVDLGSRIERSVYSSMSKRIKSNDQRTEILLRAYDEAVRTPEEAGVYPSPNGYAALMDALGRRGDLDRVRKAYEMACYVVSCLSGDPQWQAESWYLIENGIIAALAHGGDVNDAMERRHRLVSAGRAPSADTYGALITVIRETTDEALVAEELFEESQRLGVVPTRYLYNTVLSKLSRARKTERAMQIFDEMRNRGVVASSITYGAILNACTRTGDEVNAERFFAMMESDTHFKPMAPPYNTMIQLYTQTKPNRERALHYYSKLRKMGVEHTGYTYKLLLDVYGSIEPVDIQGMRDIFGRIIADPIVKVQGNHWASMITAYGIHCNDLDEAVRLYKAIPSHVATVRAGRRGMAPDALSFEALMTVLAKHKRLDMMEQYIEERRKVNGAEFTAYVANVIIKAYSTLLPEGGLDKARAVFEEMVDPPMGVAAHGNHPLQRQHVSGAHHEQIEEDRSVGLRKTAFELIKREPSTFEAMIRAEVEHDNHEQASALIHRMQQRGYPPVVVARAQDILTHHHSL